MEHGYGVAVRVDAPGVMFSDYHTAQVPPARRGHHATRRAELDARPLETILSRREYRSDSRSRWRCGRGDRAGHTGRSGGGVRQPHFCLSMAGESCPLGLPPGPVVVAAVDALAAMEARPVPAPEQFVRQQLRANATALATDVDGMSVDVPTGWTETRRDSIASRDHWQFSLRRERLIDLPLLRITP